MRDPKFGPTAFWRMVTAVMLLVPPIVGGAVTKGPDAGGYSVTDETVYSFIDIAGDGGGASILSGVDDDAAALTLPFTFTFYTQAYSMVCVSANGALYFITAPAQCAGLNDFVSTDLSSVVPAGDRPAVFPFWSDLTFQAPGAGNVLYQTIGAPGSRRFVVQWNNAYPQGSPAPVTFEAILSEGSNAIRFQYKAVDLGAGIHASKGGEATVGIRNAGAPANSQHLQWSVGAPVLGDLSALLFSARTGVAPTTTSSLSGPAGLNGWYQGPVQVTLNATDPDSAVASTSYSIDGGPAQTYAAPVTVSGNGVHNLAFSSRDAGGNQEATKTVAIRIDAAGPTITAALTPGPGSVTNGGISLGPVRGVISDAVSGVNVTSAEYAVINPAGQVVASGKLTLGAGGAYSQPLPMPIPRDANADGKRWVVRITAFDLAGNRGVSN